MANLYDQVKTLERELKMITSRIEKIEHQIRNINGAPIIQGYVGQAFTLNKSFSVIEISKQISDLQDRVTALE